MNKTKKQKLTVRDYLEVLPEPMRSKALVNLEPDMGSQFASGPKDALASAFYWKDTEEGYDYWSILYDVV
jgi:hypothetical protein